MASFLCRGKGCGNTFTDLDSLKLHLNASPGCKTKKIYSSSHSTAVGGSSKGKASSPSTPAASNQVAIPRKGSSVPVANAVVVSKELSSANSALSGVNLQPVTIGQSIVSMALKCEGEDLVVKLMYIEKYIERKAILVSDTTMYGALLKFNGYDDYFALCNEISNGTRFLAKCRIEWPLKKEKEIVLNYISKVEDINTDDERPFEGPPIAAVLSSNKTKLLVLRGVNSCNSNFVDFKYFLSAQWQNVSDAELPKILENFRRDLSGFRTEELESIASMDFCHQHELPLLKINLSNYRKSNIAKELCDIATAELNNRYGTGYREPHVKCDLPSGKYGYNSHQKRLETSMEVALRELKEEAGIPASRLQYLGRKDMLSPSTGKYGSVRRAVFFFSPMDKLDISLEKGCYNGSSWVDVDHIKASLNFSFEDSPFQSIGRFCEIKSCHHESSFDSYLDALKYTDAVVEESDVGAFNQYTKKPGSWRDSKSSDKDGPWRKV